MAIVTSAPGEGNEVKVYDVPDDVIAQYALTGDKAAKMFPEDAGGASGIPKASAEMSPTRLDNAESLSEVQAYNAICVCRILRCNAWRCWWYYYYCYC
jgi:hypothetical protein